MKELVGQALGKQIVKPIPVPETELVRVELKTQDPKIQ
jgi:hypothetical protein